MSIIDPEILKRTQEGTVLVEIRDPSGNIVGWKGRFSPHVFDNYTEALRENAKENRIQTAKSQGLNEHGQTKEQEKAFQEKKKIQQAKKEKAEMALMGAASEMRR